MPFAFDAALRKAARDLLLAEPALVSALGGPRVWDEPPRGGQRPCIVFERSIVRDWSTMSEDGEEHVLTLDVWSQEPGMAQALAIARIAASALHDAEPAIPGGRIVLMRVIDIDSGRAQGGRLSRARLRLRALIEPN